MSEDEAKLNAGKMAGEHDALEVAEHTAPETKAGKPASASPAEGVVEPAARDAETKLKGAETASSGTGGIDLNEVHARDPVKPRIRIVPFLITLAAVAIAGLLGWAMWDTYMGSPWTRDGTVRVYVVTMAPEVAGRIVELRVVDNQFVHKGDVLMVIDPTDFRINVKLTEAAVAQVEANMANAERQAERRMKLTSLAVSKEEQQTFVTQATALRAQYQQALAQRDQARVNLERTVIRSPVNGWVTNLLAQVGNYATVGQTQISVVDADSFWIDGYFTETSIHSIRVGDPAKAKLMGFGQILRGRVASIARGINVPNAQPNQQGVASVNPIFTWVRLAQRIPVRIKIEEVPEGVTLAAGMTATVQIEPRPNSPAK